MFFVYGSKREIEEEYTLVLIKFVAGFRREVLRLIYREIDLPHPFWHKEIDGDSVTLLLQSPKVIDSYEVEEILLSVTQYFESLSDVVIISTGKLHLQNAFRTGEAKQNNVSSWSVLPTSDWSRDMYWQTCLEILNLELGSITPDLDSSYLYRHEANRREPVLVDIQKYTDLSLEEINNYWREKTAFWHTLGVIWELNAYCYQLLMYRQPQSITCVEHPRKLSSEEFETYLAAQPNLEIASQKSPRKVVSRTIGKPSKPDRGRAGG